MKSSVIIQRSWVPTPVGLNLGCIILLFKSDFEPKMSMSHEIPSKLIFYFILSYPVSSCLVLSYLILSLLFYLVLFYLILPFLISSYLVLSCLVLSHLTLSCFILSYLILSYSQKQKPASLMSSINTIERSGQQYTISMDLFKSVFEHEGSSFYLRLGTLCKWMTWLVLSVYSIVCVSIYSKDRISAICMHGLYRTTCWFFML